MKPLLKFEWKRMIHSLSFRFSMLFSLLLSGIASLQQFWHYLDGIDHISVFYRWIGQSSFTFGSYYLYQLLPLLASFGYSYTASSDRTSGYIYQTVTRVSRKKLFIAKYLISAVSGGLVFICPLLLNFILLSCFMPATIPDPVEMSSQINPFQFAPQLFYTKPFLFMFSWFGVSFLWGCAMALIGLVTGMFTRRTSISVITPFMIFISESVIGIYIMQKNIFHMGFYPLQLVWNALLCSCSGGAASTLYIMGTILVIILASSFIYYIKVRKYEFL